VGLGRSQQLFSKGNSDATVITLATAGVGMALLPLLVGLPARRLSPTGRWRLAPPATVGKATPKVN